MKNAFDFKLACTTIEINLKTPFTPQLDRNWAILIYSIRKTDSHSRSEACVCRDELGSQIPFTFLMRTLPFFMHNSAALNTHERYRFRSIISRYWVSPGFGSGVSIDQLCLVFIFNLPSCTHALSCEQVRFPKEVLKTCCLKTKNQLSGCEN